jgi:hypothetical protein
MLRATENDPRQRKFPLTLSQGQGTVVVVASAIDTVALLSTNELKVTIQGHMSLYVVAELGLFSALHRAMADCADAQEQAAKKASEAIL